MKASRTVGRGPRPPQSARRPPQSTPRQRRHTAARAEILDAARALMLESGPNGVSVREVARRTGYSPASLYTYFSGREAMLAALTEASFDRLLAHLLAVPAELPADDRVVAYGLAYLKFGAENPADLAAILGSTRLNGPSPIGSRGLAAARLVADTFREGIAAGIFRRPPAAVPGMAYSTWVLVHGMTVLHGLDLSLVRDDIGGEPAEVLRAHIDSFRRPPAEGG